VVIPLRVRVFLGYWKCRINVGTAQQKHVSTITAFTSVAESGRDRWRVEYKNLFSYTSRSFGIDTRTDRAKGYPFVSSSLNVVILVAAVPAMQWAA